MLCYIYIFYYHQTDANVWAVTCHGMNGFKCDDLGHVDGHLLQQLLQVARVVVTEDVLGHAAVANALNHRRVVAGVREDVTTCKTPASGYVTQHITH